MALSRKDVNHIFKLVYDDEREALRMIPSDETSFAIELDAEDGDCVEVRSMAVDTTVLFDNVSASQDHVSSSVNILKYKNLAVSVVADTTIDAVVTLQASLDDVTYHNISSSSISSSHLFNISDANYKYFRLKYDKTNTVSGNITAKYVLKG